jgi:D-alanine-D-alanine ligase
VVTGLRDLGHEVQPLGLYDDLTPLRQAIQNFEPHIVFNLLEEFRGETMLEQNVVSYLELVQVPYTGCNPRGLIIARDKALSKKILHYHRIRGPRFAVVPAGRKLRHKPARLDYPLIVKSQVEEASFGIAEASLVNNDEKLAERIEFMHANVGTSLILEQYVDGRELYVGVMGNSRLQVLPVWELEMRGLRSDAPRIATRRVKWNLKFQERRGIEIGPARDLPPEVERLLVKTTKRLYRLLQLSGYARVDFRLDAEGRPYFLEANPNPDIGYGDEFAEAAEAAGIDYEPLLDRLLAIGLRKR